MQELRKAKDVCEVANKDGIRAVFYQSGDRIELLDEILLLPYFEVEGGEVQNLYISFYNGESFLAYTDASQSHSGLVIGSQSRYFLFGKHGRVRKDIVTQEYDFSSTELIFADNAISNFAYDVNGYVLEPKARKRSLTIVCENE